MSPNRLLPAAAFVLALGPGSAAASSELEQMRAALGEMQKLLQQQQARIEQLEKLAADRPVVAPAPLPKMPATPAMATTAAAAPPGPALATLYGRLDLFAESNWGGGQGERLAIESGGMNGSRLGVKGAADLRADTRLIYQLEAGFFGNNGRLGQSSDGNPRLFGRQAYVGVEGHFGRLTVGRQYSPYFMESIRYDALDNGYGSATNGGNVKPGPTRYDNALIYTAPAYRGLTATGMLALGGKTGGSERNAVALAVDYTHGPLGLGAAYLYDNHNSVDTQRSHYAFAGGSYQLGRVRLLAGVGGVDTRPDGGVASEWRNWMIGSRLDVTRSGQLWLSYGEGHDRRAPADRGRVYSAAWMEAINPQLRAYLAYALHVNDAGSALAPSGGGAGGYYTVNPGDDANGLALGLQYAF